MTTRIIAQFMTSGMNSSATMYLLSVPEPSPVTQPGYTSSWPMREQFVPKIPPYPPPLHPCRGMTDSPFPTEQFSWRERDRALLPMRKYPWVSGYGRHTRWHGYWTHIPTDNYSDLFQYIWHATLFRGRTYRIWDDGMRMFSLYPWI